jgi:hypothetical protein
VNNTAYSLQYYPKKPKERYPMGTPIQTMTVSIIDESSNPLAVSKIEAVSASTVPLAPGPGGVPRVNLSSLTEGPFKIRMTFPDRPMFELPFILKKSHSEWLVNHVGDRPMCCSLTRQKIGESEKWTELRFNLIVKFKKRHEEVIFIAGWDYEHGTDFSKLCNTYRDDLYKGTSYGTGVKKSIQKNIFDNTLVTLFDFKTGIRTYVLKSLRGWTNVGSCLQGDTPTWTEKFDVMANIEKRHSDNSISILHVYDYICYLGQIAPNSLKELHFMSHAFYLGPILINTYRESRYNSVFPGSLRDPGDKDPRSNDFSANNIKKYNTFKTAFSNNSIVKIWGCNASPDVHAYARAAGYATNDTNKYKVKIYDKDGVLIDTVETTKQDTIKLMHDQVFPLAYAFNFKKALGNVAHVYGAPPGAGANLRTVVTSTDKKCYSYIDKITYKSDLNFYKSVFKIKLDDTNFMEF